jgi:predicted metal-dependent HD superfamily phosphohydrolase
MIEALLAEPQLFRTPMARQRWEAAARTNLREELVTLTLD